MVCWCDAIGVELNIAANVLSMLSWAPMCALRSCHVAAAQALELMAAQPMARVELSWVRVSDYWQSDCLSFVSQHCRNVQQLAIHETAKLSERMLLRLVCGMRQLESLEVGASAFGGAFPEPQRLLDRLAKYCPKLQQLAITFRHYDPSDRHVLSVRALAWLGRRLLSLDLGAVPVRVPGGTRTLAACCPLLERLCAQLCQQQARQIDLVSPSDLSRGCPRLAELELAPIDWDDSALSQFAAEAPQLRALALRQVAPHATPALLAPLLLVPQGQLARLHLALHARTDALRAKSWLVDIGGLHSLRSLSLDYAAPLRLHDIAHALLGGGGIAPPGDICELAPPPGNVAVRGHRRGLESFTVHGCHSVDDIAVRWLILACPELEVLQAFPDSWRDVGDVTDAALRALLEGLPRLRVLTIGSRAKLLSTPPTEVSGGCIRSLSLFAPLDDTGCAVAATGTWGCLRHLWLGPHKLMERGVGAECLITDAGLAIVVGHCPELLDLTVASLHVTDAGATSALRTCRELRRVRFGGRGVTDAMLAFLKGLPQPRLERLTLWFSGVSTAGARRAEEEMPWTYFDVEVSDMP